MKDLFNRLVKYFVEGLLIVLPLTCTALFILYGLTKFHQALTLLVRYIPLLSSISMLPGVSILIVGFALCVVGYMSSHFVIRYVFDVLERLILNIPILGLVYSYTKESASGFLGKFDTPVLVTVNATLKTEKVGFITQKNLKNLHIEGKVAVYLPYAYSFAGETLIVAQEYVKVLEGVSSTDLLRFSLTGGLAEVKQSLTVKK